MPRVVDLFAGCGGMSRGFLNAGFDIVGAFEFWDIAADCYEKNFEHPVYRADLSNVKSAAETIAQLNPDIIIGGPPCQDFSHAGKRIEAGRASLTGSFAEIINLVRPKMFIMENVDRAAKSEAYVYARSVFKEVGYGLTEVVLDASRCGAPQKRKRFFCIGMLGKPDGFASEIINLNLSERSTTLRDYFGETLGLEFYYRHPRNYSRRAIFSIDEPAPTVRGVNRPVPQGYPGHPNDACPLNNDLRSLTTLERALIQTFPADFKWCGSKTEMEQMIGNAVPIKLAEFVANAAMAIINEEFVSAIDKDGFRKWLEFNKEYTDRTKHDVVSRIKRANSILPFNTASIPLYIFKLEQTDEYQSLTSPVRSQLKRAISLYAQFYSNVSSM